MLERFYGVGEPLIQRQRDQGIDAPMYLDLVKGLGCNAYRAWMHLTELLVDPTTPNPEEVERHRRLLDRVCAGYRSHGHEPRVVIARRLQTEERPRDAET